MEGASARSPAGTVDGGGAAALVATGVCVDFEGVRAVDGIDVRLEQGEIVGLIGPNGAGKTTLMNALSGFVRLTAGTVSIGGLNVTGWPARRLVGHGLVRTFQEVATFPRLSVFENVEVGALGAGLGRREARRRAWELLGSTGLRDRAHQPASALPHGEERRVGIARAVATRPRFLLLDEPAAGLDDTESMALTEAIAGLREELACAILLVEHDMHVIFRVCERIQVLDYGKTIASGTSEEVSTDRAVVAAYLGAKGARLA